MGPNSDDVDVLLGNYNGTPSNPVNVLQGIRNRAGKDIEIIFEKGMESYNKNGSAEANSEAKKQAALAAAAKSDVVIFVGGISPRLEGEEMRVNMEGFSGGDRTSLNLPKEQEDLLKALKGTGKPVVLVLMSGSALAVNWGKRKSTGYPASLVSRTRGWKCCCRCIIR